MREINEDHHSVIEQRIEEQKVVLIIELSNAQIQQDTVVVESMHASTTLVAMFHSRPLNHPAVHHLTPVFLTVAKGGVAVRQVASRVADNDQVVEQDGNQ